MSRGVEAAFRLGLEVVIQSPVVVWVRDFDGNSGGNLDVAPGRLTKEERFDSGWVKRMGDMRLGAARGVGVIVEARVCLVRERYIKQASLMRTIEES